MSSKDSFAGRALVSFAWTSWEPQPPGLLCPHLAGFWWMRMAYKGRSEALAAKEPSSALLLFPMGPSQGWLPTQ